MERGPAPNAAGMIPPITVMNPIQPTDRRNISSRPLPASPTALIHLPGIAKPSAPFRFGCTSFLLPADILPNVEYVAGLVDDVEILIFESDAISPLPAPDVVRALARMRATHNLSYSVHLPLDAYLADPDPAIRETGVQKCLRVRDRLQSAGSPRYVLHTEPSNGQPDLHGALQALQAAIQGGFAPASLCIEYNNPFFHDMAEPARENGISFCMDVGHLLLHGENPLHFIDRYGDNIQIIHLHGVADGRDHHDLSHLDAGLLKAVLDFAASSANDLVVTIEVFKQDRFLASLAILEKYL